MRLFRKKDRLILWMFKTLYDESMFCYTIEILFNHVWKRNNNLFFNIRYHIGLNNNFKPITIKHSCDLAKFIWYGILNYFFIFNRCRKSFFICIINLFYVVFTFQIFQLFFVIKQSNKIYSNKSVLKEFKNYQIYLFSKTILFLLNQFEMNKSNVVLIRIERACN